MEQQQQQKPIIHSTNGPPLSILKTFTKCNLIIILANMIAIPGKIMNIGP